MVEHDCGNEECKDFDWEAPHEKDEPPPMVPHHYHSAAEHIAAIEAGWTLPKPWKARDEEATEQENIDDVTEMLDRWKAHGITAIVQTDVREETP